MDDNELVVSCVVLLLLSFTLSQCEEQCNYKYPGPAMPEVKDCNLELPVPLELICQVDSTINDSFTIQWHYSDSSSPPSKNNSISMETILVRNNMIEIYNTSPQVSMLRLTNYSNNTEMASGHYWCTVQYQTLETLSNPSKVVNINICPFTGNKAEEQGMDGCAVQVNLVVMTNRCAEDAASIVIEKVQLGSNEMCAMEDLDQDVEESTTTDEAFPNHDQSTIMILPTSGFPMYNVWMIVGIAFGILITIIIVMLIAIIYLNHKKNKIRVSTMTQSHIHNPYIESNNPEESPRRETLVGATTDQHEIRAEAGYEIPINVIHAHNATFGGDHSPDSKTESTSALHTPPPEYEEVSTVKSTRDSIKATQRHQYEMVESGEQSEYSHLQHAHGGSRKFSTNSTGTAPSLSMSQNRGKMSITSSLSLSGHQPEPIFDSPEYMTIKLDGSKSTKTRPETGEGVTNTNSTGYSHINNEALKGMDTTREEEGPDLDSEGYHQLPSVFTGEAKQQPNGEISPEQRQNSHTTNAHPPAHRHKSATLASEPYTPAEMTNVMKRNAYSFTIVSTDEQYVSERGHVYHLLERSDEHQQNQSTPGSDKGSPKFRLQEDDSTKDRSSIPPYSQVNKSPEQDSNKQKESEEQSESSSLQGSSTESSHKVISPYSQVDKSNKKNRQPQAQLDTQLNPETHHYHILEQNSEDKVENLCSEKGGPIYHIIDHKP